MNSNKIIAFSFSLLYAILSLGMLMAGREDDDFVYGAFVFLVVSLSTLWFFYTLFERKQSSHKAIWFVLVAIGISSMIIPAWWATETISKTYDAAIEDNFRSTTVTDLQDEVLFSERNNPIGIRLHYKVTIPRSGHYYPKPSVSYDKSRAGHFHLTAVKINPLPQLDVGGVSLSGNYKAGVTYEIIADLRPQFLLSDEKTGDPCVFFASSDEENNVKNATDFQALEIDIGGTSFNRYYGQGIHYLEHKYSLKSFYDSIASENIPRCAGY
jgi:hypothetical protein